VKYSKGFKYQLCEDESCIIPIRGFNIDEKYYSLDPNGLFVLKAGFAWDGCSGSIDTKTNKRGGAFHDAGCLMVARGLLPVECMPALNRMFYNHLHEDGMTSIRAWWHYEVVELHFAGGTKPERREVFVA